MDQVVAAKVPTLERLGGGSVRCMLAELFKRRGPVEVGRLRGGWRRCGWRKWVVEDVYSEDGWDKTDMDGTKRCISISC